jgi:hypothetical protein
MSAVCAFQTRDTSCPLDDAIDGFVGDAIATALAQHGDALLLIAELVKVATITHNSLLISAAWKRRSKPIPNTKRTRSSPWRASTSAKTSWIWDRK